MEVNDGPSEWEAIASVYEREDEIRRMTVSVPGRFLPYALSAVEPALAVCRRIVLDVLDVTISSGIERLSTLQIAEDLSQVDRALVELAGHPVQQMHAIAR